MTQRFSEDNRPLLRQGVGRKGEEEALKLLQEKGFEVIERNLRNRFGEIDLIARKNETVVFVEVKTRTSRSFGLPLDALDSRKRRRIIGAAKDYLSKNPALRKCTLRFDAVGVEVLEGGGLRVEHIEDAFEADE